jgi:ABC-type glycerol-3-phosphate transport system substrate-binding protein
MKNIAFKIFPLIFVFLIVTLLSGCLTTENEVNEPTPAPTATPEPPPYSEHLNLLMMAKPVKDSKVALSSDDLTIKFLEDKYNITFDFIDTANITEDSSYTELLRTTIASGTIPDFMNMDILGSGKSAYYKLVQAKALVDISAFMKSHEADYPKINQYILKDPEVENYKTPEGTLYSLPNYKGPNTTVYLVRGDWAEKAGITPSEVDTLDEFRTLMTAFVDGKFDEKDAVGLSTGNQRYLDPIFAGFTGCYKFKEIDGDYVDWFTLPEMREALAYLHDMYKTNAFDKDYISHDGAVCEKKITTGVAGCVATDISHLPALEVKLKENHPDALLEPLPVSITGPNGIARVTDDTLTSASLFGVYFEDPARMFDMCELLFSEEGMNIISYGIKGKHYATDGDKIVPKYTVYEQEGWKYDAEGKSDNLQDYNEIRNIITQLEVVGKDNYPKVAVDWYNTLISSHEIFRNPILNKDYVPTKKLSGYNSVKDKYVDEFISGKRKLDDANWEKFQNAYLKAGAKAQMDYYNNPEESE